MASVNARVWTVVVAAALLAGCGSPAAPGGHVVRYGIVIDRTGSLAEPQWQDAALLAEEDANAGLAQAGGYKDLHFDLLFTDSSNDPSVALGRAVALRKQGVVGLVTDTGADEAAMLASVYDSDPSNDLAVPIVCMACTSPQLGNPAAVSSDPAVRSALRNEQGWGFRSVADSSDEGMLLVRLARSHGYNGDVNGDGVRKIGIEVVDDLDGLGLFQSIESARDTQMSGAVIETVRHEPAIYVDTHDWNADMVQLTDDRNEQLLGQVDGKPDFVMADTFPLYTAALTRAFLEADIQRTIFIHHHNWRSDQTLIKLSTFDLNGQEGISYSIVDNCATSGKTFWNEIRGQNGRDPTELDAQTYDATMVLMLGTLVAAQQQNLTNPSRITPAQLRDAMGQLTPLSPGDPGYDPMVEAQRVQVSAGPGGFAAAVRAVHDGKPIDYVGASGPMDFDAHGNVRGKFAHYRVDNEQFSDVETYDCVSDPSGCPSTPGACRP